MDLTTLCFCSTLTVRRKKAGGHTVTLRPLLLFHTATGDRENTGDTCFTLCNSVQGKDRGLMFLTVTVYREKTADICFTLCDSVQGKDRGLLFHTV